jgi:ATP-dependent helicase/nuclease subunit A
MAHNLNINWTDEQREAIETVDHSVLVSAAAGSGKTAVLAERCAYLVCDAPNKCDVNELLVVTFTKAAAAEMRGRIESALRQRFEQSQDQRLTKQLLLLNRANISTLHSFCQTVLRQHFNLVGIDPNSRVLDDEEVLLLKHEIARDLFDDRFETDANGEFQNFIDVYGNGDGENLMHQVISLHDLLGSIVDQDKWLKTARAQVAEAAIAKPLTKSKLGSQLAANVRDWLADIEVRFVHLAGQIAEIDGLDQYGEYVNDLLAAIGSWREAFGIGNFNALSSEIANFAPAKLSLIKNPPSQKEQMQANIDSMRKEMREGTIAQLARFTEDQWRTGLKQTAPALDVLIALVEDFGKSFAAAKRELRGLDFTDLERFTLQILRDGDSMKPSSVARSYHQQFKHVLVDEYQDINEVQDAILCLVSRECVCGETDTITNLFCVGDVKQSIYRFRLAEPARFLERYSLFKNQPPLPPGEGRGEGVLENRDVSNTQHALTLTLSRRERGSEVKGRVIDLSSNFRSRGPLLDAINGVFERLMTVASAGIEYDQSHRLRTGAKYPKNSRDEKCFHGSPIELHLLPAPARISSDEDATETDQGLDRSEREAAFVAKRIKELMSQSMCVADKSADGSPMLRPIQYRDIVILLRSMKFKSEQFAQALRTAGIPVHSDSGSGFFDAMEIRDMRSLLRVLDNQQQDVPLAAVLRSPICGLAQPDDCLARIRLAYRNSEIPFHQAAINYAREQKDELAAQLKEFFQQLNDWREMANQRPLAELIWQVYDSTGYLAFCAGMRDGQQRVANLIDFHERARQFGTFQRQGLGRFMEFLDQLADRSGDVGQPSIASEADDVVRIMSVHRSKGLEFPVVFLPDLGKKHNLQDAHGSILVDRQAHIGMMVADQTRQIRYPSLAHVLVEDRIKKQSLAEELRILYVAMTRAKEHLILVGTCSETAIENWGTWSKHVGAMPAQRVLCANTFLDWIGPAAAMMSGATDRIEVTAHSEDEAAQWSITSQRVAELSPRQESFAALLPLAPAPKMHPDAQRVKDRLMAIYSFDDFTKVPAVQSVGALTKPQSWSGGGDFRVDSRAELPIPKCAQQNLKPAATDIGSATHQVLEHLDFSRASDRADLAAQVAEILEKKLLIASSANTVQLDSIVWFLSTPLGKLLRLNHRSLRRETQIYFPQKTSDAASDDPLDRTMVRGRVDVLIPVDETIVIADYKTDRVDSRNVDARAMLYQPQLLSYKNAIAAITGKNVTAHLVFLVARVIRDV